MPLESIRSRIAARFTNTRTASALTSSACGILAMCWTQQALAGFGTSLISQTALTIVSLLGVGLGLAASNCLTLIKAGNPVKNQLWLLILLQSVIALTVLLPDVFYTAGWAAIDVVTGESLPASTNGQIAALCCGLCVSWLVPFAAIVTLFSHQSNSHGSTHFEFSGSSRLVIAAVAATVTMTTLSGTLGLSEIALLALPVSIAGSVIESLLALRAQNATATNGDAGPHPSPMVSQAASDTSLQKILPLVAFAVLSGVLFATLSRVSGQLFFASSWLSVLKCSSIIIGAIASRWLIKTGTTSVAHLMPIAAAWAIASLAAWPAVVSFCLNINSGISSVVIAATARAFVTTACILPAGLVIGAATAWRTNKEHQPESTGFSRLTSFVTIASILAGWLCSQWWLAGQFSTQTIVIAISTIFAISAVRRIIRVEPRQTLLRPTFAVCSIVLVVSSIFSHRYTPTTSAKLLFDTAVFVAHQHEARSDILPHLDEGRCVATAETDHGTLTFWRYRGQQLQVRSSGLPVSSVSCDTNICTQPSAESLQTILPMVMHEGPTRLMLLGARSGAVLQTSIAFPLESIVCVEPDENVVSAVSDNVFTQITPNPLNDSRVSLQIAEPLLKLRTAREQADIIIASADQQGVPQAASSITTEFLESAAGALREDGLFCQPLDYADFGPDALQVIVETWQSVFSEVAAVEIAPGKLLLIATNSPAGIFRKGIVDRLQRPNVRFALAQTGWDWSTPLRLSTYTDQGLTTAFGEPRGRVSDVSSNRLTCLLPWEVMRWGDKYTAIMDRLGPHTQTLQFTIGEEAYSPKVSSRLAELTEQQKLIHDHPDEYWFYRRTVKKRLKDTPQSELVQVKGQEPLHQLHEDEKRRVDYFTALGAAARQKVPTPDDLLAVEEFASPHDPLISLFLHQEVAELATRNRAENFQIELQNRLHRIYFTASNDRAVRNVIASIELLCEYPEAIPNDADRGDQLDALLQTLHDRWHNRGETPPGSTKIVLNDIEQSVAAIDNAFTELASLNDSRGYSPNQWQARKLALEKSLRRPLQAYRSTLMPHHAKARKE